MTDMIARLADVKPPAELLLQVDMAEAEAAFPELFVKDAPQEFDWDDQDGWDDDEADDD